MSTVEFVEIAALSPALIVTVTAVFVLLVDVFARPATDRAYAAWLTAGGLAVAFVANLWIGDAGTQGKGIFFGFAAVDGLTVFANALILAAAAATALLANAFFRVHGLHRGEFYALMLLATLGALLMVASTDLLGLFVALELMSIAIYVLAGYQRHTERAAEAALKYFLMGAFSSAFLLYGIAFLYGACGTTSLAALNAHVRDTMHQVWALSGDVPVYRQLIAGQPFLVLGMVLTLLGLFFKVAAVPFHMWTPDVYDGAPSPTTAFMAAVVKIAAFVVLVRLFLVPFHELYATWPGWSWPVYVVAILTMVWGNLAAVSQDNIKRMLAYSSIAHAGYLLVGLLAVAHPEAQGDVGAIPYYLLVYAILTVGAFGVIILLGNGEGENLELSKGWAGLGWKRPWIGFAMLVFMLGMAGIPPTAGFFGKFYLFAAAVRAGWVDLAIIGVLTSLISVYYYLRVTVYLFLERPTEDRPTIASVPAEVVVVACAALVLLIGIWGGAFDSASEATGGLYSARWLSWF